jgi:hypothetical protein
MDMKPSRFTEEQIIGMLREQEAGAKTADVCRKYGISSATFSPSLILRLGGNLRVIPTPRASETD